MTDLKKTLGLTVGSRFFVGGQFPTASKEPFVRLIGEGVFAWDDQELDWLRASYRDATEYVCMGRDDEAGVILAAGYRTPEFALVDSTAVDEADCMSPACWSSVICRDIIVPEQNGFVSHHIVHYDLLGREIGDEVDMIVVTMDGLETFNEAWHETLESSRLALDGRRMTVFYARKGMEDGEA